MSDDLKSLLSKIVKNSELHARWLNTFSYLEYIGFRKIVKSQMAQCLTFETLKHAVEEGRHAMLLKKLALKLAGVSMQTYSEEALLCKTEAEAYFQNLDRACEEEFSSLGQGIQVAGSVGVIDKPSAARLTYLCLTWLIEVRALSIYGCYQEACATEGLQASLGNLLLEEQHHLAFVENKLLNTDLDFMERSKKLKLIEEDLYRKYCSALRKEILRPEHGRELIL